MWCPRPVADTPLRSPLRVHRCRVTIQANAIDRGVGPLPLSAQEGCAERPSETKSPAEPPKLDPFDVSALEKSLNDSATRVSTFWVSFLIFSLYLLTAAATVEHRQLFLAEPVKLPVLNIDLPLWGFFFLAPILFAIFHAYVLLQVLLLARTAAAYNDAVAKVVGRDGLAPEQDASLRQRLANTLFAQIFAGSPREREGWLGWLLKAMAWITLAIAPILILLIFQFMFLSYHSHIATWTHRALIAFELVTILLLWPLVLDDIEPSRDTFSKSACEIGPTDTDCLTRKLNSQLIARFVRDLFTPPALGQSNTFYASTSAPRFLNWEEQMPSMKIRRSTVQVQLDP
jgi:hypothetical protein